MITRFKDSNISAMNNSLNSTTFDNEIILWLCNEQNLPARVPAIYFSGFLMTVGIVGNIFVVYAYGIKFKKTPANFLLCSLGVIDLVCCMISIPFEIFTLRFHSVNFNTVACKTFRGVGMAAYISEGFMLICIAFDRYNKVCRPLQANSLCKPSSNVSVIVILGIIFGWPAIFIFGEHAVETGVPGLYGKSCTVDDSVEDTIYPTLFFGSLLLLFIVCCSLIVVLYGKMFYTIQKWKNSGETLNFKYKTQQMQFGKQKSSVSSSRPYESSKLFSKRAIYYINVDLYNYNSERPNYITTSNSCGTLSDSSSATENETFRTISNIRKNSRMAKTTVICLTVTVAFIISYVPYLIFQIMLKTNHINEENESLLVNQLLEVAAKSYCINNASNAVIYSIFNPKFRQACKGLFCHK